jgi:hypothetical protein
MAGSTRIVDFIHQVSGAECIGRKRRAGRLETAEIYFTAGNVSSEKEPLLMADPGSLRILSGQGRAAPDKPSCTARNCG